MRYRNLRTGSVIDISGELTGEYWEALDALPDDPGTGTEEEGTEPEELREEIPEEDPEEKPKKKTKKKESKE